jgi:hypothetical protein
MPKNVLWTNLRSTGNSWSLKFHLVKQERKMANVFQIRRLIFASPFGCQNFKGVKKPISKQILRFRIILGKNCTALPLEVGARPSHVDHGGSVLNCYQFELAGLIVLNLKYWFLHSLEILATKRWCEYETTYLENV